MQPVKTKHIVILAVIFLIATLGIASLLRTGLSERFLNLSTLESIGDGEEVTLSANKVFYTDANIICEIWPYAIKRHFMETPNSYLAEHGHIFFDNESVVNFVFFESPDDDPELYTTKRFSGSFRWNVSNTSPSENCTILDETSVIVRNMGQFYELEIFRGEQS